MPLKAAVTVTEDAVYVFGGTTAENQPLDQLLQITVTPGTQTSRLVRFLLFS